MGIHRSMLQYCLVVLHQMLCMVKNINIAIHVSFEHCMSLLYAWYLIYYWSSLRPLSRHKRPSLGPKSHSLAVLLTVRFSKVL